MKILSLTALFVASLVFGSAQASETSIAVSANVESSLEILTVDGRPFTDMSIDMPFNPDTQTLEKVKVEFAFISNDSERSIGMSLGASPVLKSTSGAQTIPLNVTTQGGHTLVESTPLKFPPRTISQLHKPVSYYVWLEPASKKPLSAGQYSGKITLVIKHEL